jgi:hypothetical protein
MSFLSPGNAAQIVMAAVIVSLCLVSFAIGFSGKFRKAAAKERFVLSLMIGYPFLMMAFVGLCWMKNLQNASVYVPALFIGPFTYLLLGMSIRLVVDGKAHEVGNIRLVLGSLVIAPTLTIYFFNFLIRNLW